MTEDISIEGRVEAGVEADAFEFVLQLCRDAIAIAETPPASVTTKGNAFDLVTSVDRAVEQRLRERIGDRFPDHAILGEEEGLDGGRAGWTWVLDPIDGTFNLATGLGAAACSIALMKSDQVAVGGVADLTTGVVYSARRGGGVLVDGGSHAEAADGTTIGQSRLFLEFGAERLDRDLVGVLGSFAQALPIVPRLIGSAAVALVAVALRGGVFAGIGLRIWDVAAGVLLADERGHVSRWWPGPDEAVHVLVGPRERVEVLEPVMLEAIDLWQVKEASRSEVPKHG